MKCLFQKIQLKQRIENSCQSVYVLSNQKDWNFLSVNLSVYFQTKKIEHFVCQSICFQTKWIENFFLSICLLSNRKDWKFLSVSLSVPFQTKMIENFCLSICLFASRSRGLNISVCLFAFKPKGLHIPFCQSVCLLSNWQDWKFLTVNLSVSFRTKRIEHFFLSDCFQTKRTENFSDFSENNETIFISLHFYMPASLRPSSLQGWKVQYFQYGQV